MAANEPIAENEAAVDANLVAKKAEIDSSGKNVQEKKTNTERLEPAKQVLKLQNELVQYLTSAVNGTELSQDAKSKYRKIIEKEKRYVLQLEHAVKIFADAAKYDPPTKTQAPTVPNQNASVGKISEKNLVKFGSREEAIQAGKAPCAICKP